MWVVAEVVGGFTAPSLILEVAPTDAPNSLVVPIEFKQLCAEANKIRVRKTVIF
jgi:hypothetical protein